MFSVALAHCQEFSIFRHDNTRRKIPFKSYSPKQAMSLPPSLEEMVPVNHPVRVVDRVIDQIDIHPLISTYKGGGSSGYDPRMLLKVLVYAYLRNIYSSRQMEDSLKENIYFMWLSGMNMPDHNTINRFRGKRLEGHLKDIFSAVVLLLSEEGHLSIKEVFVDGTRLKPMPIATLLFGEKPLPPKNKKSKTSLNRCGCMHKTYTTQNYRNPKRLILPRYQPKKLKKQSGKSTKS